MVASVVCPVTKRCPVQMVPDLAVLPSMCAVELPASCQQAAIWESAQAACLLAKLCHSCWAILAHQVFSGHTLLACMLFNDCQCAMPQVQGHSKASRLCQLGIASTDSTAELQPPALLQALRSLSALGTRIINVIDMGTQILIQHAGVICAHCNIHAMKISTQVSSS